MPPKHIYVLDSYPILAFLNEEKGVSKVESILEKAKIEQAKVYMHLINLGEVYYIIYKNRNRVQADFIYAEVKQYPIQFIEELSDEWILKAASIKAEYSIAYANAFAVTTAMQKKGVLVTGDKELESIERGNLIEILWLN